MPRSLSKSTLSSSATRPRSGASRPAMRLTAVVLPHPEGPNRRRRPASASSNLTSRRNAPRCLAAATESISGPSMRRTRRANHSDSNRPPSPSATDSTASRAAACSPPGSCSAEYSAKRQRASLPGDVRHERDDRAEFAQRGREGGDALRPADPAASEADVTLAKRSMAPAPRVRAASSRPRSMLSREIRMARTIRGKDITAVASAAPLRVKIELDAERALEPSADRAARAEQEQQYIAHRDRRQHQRQVHHGVEQRVPQEAPPRQHPGDQESGGRADGDAAQGDAQAEAQRFAFVGAQPDHGAAPGLITHAVYWARRDATPDPRGILHGLLPRRGAGGGRDAGPNRRAAGQSGNARFADLFCGAALFAGVPRRSAGHQYLALDLAADTLRHRAAACGRSRAPRNYRQIWMPEGSPLAVYSASPHATRSRAGCKRRWAIACGWRSA